MLRIFAGRENIDKERFIYDRVNEHGGETLVLVPDQYTLVAEEQALKYLGTDCLFNVEITSMNRLGLRVLREQGTESVRMIDKYGRFMLLSMLIREHQEDFDIFSRVAGKLTFTSMLNDFISEFKQQDCTLEKLREMSGDAGGDPILEAKLRELSGVITAYEKAIEGRYTDKLITLQPGPFEINRRIRLPRYLANGDFIIDLYLNQPSTQDFFRARGCLNLHIEGFYDPFSRPLILGKDGFIGLESE